jgi:hypothetical protein
MEPSMMSSATRKNACSCSPGSTAADTTNAMQNWRYWRVKLDYLYGFRAYLDVCCATLCYLAWELCTMAVLFV